ncbi:MAG: DsrE/DsrF/DrsH-like family protein [Chloroflexi bacterium]|nr:DsrE/DsrF/DrsH-like family protein [Chloroflexota bacterium]
MANNGDTRKVAFICSKGSLDMAYPALIMGWAALGNGIDVTIFFTFWGLDMITKSRMNNLELSPIGNTNMKMSGIGIPNIVSVLPGMTAVATAMMKSKMTALEVPPVGEYLQMMADAGAKMYGCKMTVDMNGLKKEDFPDYVLDVVTAADFMDMTAGAQIIFI